MPVKIQCTHCSLRFSVGRYHYHVFSRGYIAKEFLVCSACGTQHAIEIALSDRGPEEFKLCDVVLTAVSDEARGRAIALILDAFKCTLDEAEEELANLPVELRYRLVPDVLKDWQASYDRPGLTIEYPVVDTVPNPYGPPFGDQLLSALQPDLDLNNISRKEYGPDNTDFKEQSLCQPRTDAGGINLAVEPCSFCSRPGTLANDYTTNWKCPHCGTISLETLSFWMT